jgi:carbonic anhydrase
MRVHTKETQASLTPRMALEILQEGNGRFIKNLKAQRDLLGQVNATRDHVEMGNLTELLSKLQPAVYAESETTAIDKRNSKNGKFVENVSSLNVKRGVKNIIERSFILEEMLDKGEIGIVGAMHNINTGKVDFYKDVLYIKDEKNPKFSIAELRH